MPDETSSHPPKTVTTLRPPRKRWIPQLAEPHTREPWPPGGFPHLPAGSSRLEAPPGQPWIEPEHRQGLGRFQQREFPQPGRSSSEVAVPVLIGQPAIQQLESFAVEPVPLVLPAREQGLRTAIAAEPQQERRQVGPDMVKDSGPAGVVGDRQQ